MAPWERMTRPASGGLGERPPRRALISGGTSGIGYACAEHLVGRGDQVWVLGSSADGVASALDRIALAGASVCDVSVESEVEAAVAELAPPWAASTVSS